MQLLTVAQAAEKLGVNQNYVYQLINSGKLNAANIGSGMSRARWRVTAQAIEEFIEGRTIKPVQKKIRPRLKKSKYRIFD